MCADGRQQQNEAAAAARRPLRVSDRNGAAHSQLRLSPRRDETSQMASTCEREARTHMAAPASTSTVPAEEKERAGWAELGREPRRR